MNCRLRRAPEDSGEVGEVARRDDDDVERPSCQERVGLGREGEAERGGSAVKSSPTLASMTLTARTRNSWPSAMM